MSILRADAAHLPFADDSVDLIVTSPPYFALRSYRDDGEHYDGQIGSEPTPRAFLEALWTATAEMWRVLKPSGSLFLNLGDKYAGSGGHNNSNIGAKPQRGPTSYNKSVTVRADHAGAYRERQRMLPDSFGGIRDKSLIGLPWRYALGCIDGEASPTGEGWVLRAEIVWQKRNGMPESVRDRVRRSHEQWFHLTKCEQYYSALDEIREPYHPDTARRYTSGFNERSIDLERPTVNTKLGGDTYDQNPLGKVPGSVWEIPTDPLIIPEVVRVHYDLPEHFAAFPIEWPRRLILGWSPPGICTECGEGRRPITERTVEFDKARDQEHATDIARRAVDRTTGSGGTARTTLNGQTSHTVVGYVCACTPRTSHRGARGDWKEGRESVSEKGSDDFHSPGNAVPRRPGGFGTNVPAPALPMWEYHLDGWEPPPSVPAVILDPFGGTGTVAGVARSLGRLGISADLSWDYCRLGQWRVYKSTHFSKATNRTNAERQGALW